MAGDPTSGSRGPRRGRVPRGCPRGRGRVLTMERKIKVRAAQEARWVAKQCAVTHAYALLNVYRTAIGNAVRDAMRHPERYA